MHTSYIYENKQDLILGLAISIFDIKIMTKSSAIELFFKANWPSLTSLSDWISRASQLIFLTYYFTWLRHNFHNNAQRIFNLRTPHDIMANLSCNLQYWVFIPTLIYYNYLTYLLFQANSMVLIMGQLSQLMTVLN